MFQVPESYPYSEWDISLLTIQVIQQLVVITLCGFLALSFWIKYVTKKRTKQVFILALYSTMIGLSLLAATIPMILAILNPKNPWILGFPILSGESGRLWWTNLTYVIITSASFCIPLFVYQVFETPPKIIIIFYITLLVGFNFWNVYHGIPYGGVNVWEIMNGIPMAIMFFSINMIPWLILLVKSTIIHRKLKPSVDKSCLGMLSLGAGFMIASFMMFGLRAILSSFMDVHMFEVLYWIFFIITGIFVYIGYISPIWFVNYVKKRLGIIAETSKLVK